MKFSGLEKKMKCLEVYNNLSLNKDKYIILRIDGRGFSSLTKKVLSLEKPFDFIMNNYMIETVEHLMNDSGFDILYGYIQSDEISLLLSTGNKSFNGKLNKILSIIPSEASGFLSIKLNHPVAFDCRVVELDTIDQVVDYFLWRREDAYRNCIQSYVYWKLIDEGYSGKKAQNFIKTLSYEDKLNFIDEKCKCKHYDIPAIYKYGVGLFFDIYNKIGFNPITQTTTKVERKRINFCHQIEEQGLYANFLIHIIRNERHNK